MFVCVCLYVCLCVCVGLCVCVFVCVGVCVGVLPLQRGADLPDGFLVVNKSFMEFALLLKYTCKVGMSSSELRKHLRNGRSHYRVVTPVLFCGEFQEYPCYTRFN